MGLDAAPTNTHGHWTTREEDDVPFPPFSFINLFHHQSEFTSINQLQSVFKAQSEIIVGEQQNQIILTGKNDPICKHTSRNALNL
jgi:hypothetical protein